MNNTEEMIKDLNTEDFLSSIFIILGLLSIYGDQVQKKYIQTNNQEYQKQANNIFDTIIFITFILYIFFLYRNYKNYEKEKTVLYKIGISYLKLMLFKIFIYLPFYYVYV